jgi:hypothetical protein
MENKNNDQGATFKKSYLDDFLNFFSSDNQPVSQPNVMNNTASVKSIPAIRTAPPLEPTTEDDSDSRFLMSLIGQGIASLGAGIRGGDVGQVARQFNYMREAQGRQDERRKLQEEQKKQMAEITNPKSQSSIAKRKLYSQVMGINIPDNISASDLSDTVVLQGLRDQAQPKPIPGRVGGGGVGVAKPKEESKDQKQADIFTSNTETIKKQLEDYRKAIKAIKSPIGYAAEKAKAESIANSLLLKIKTAEKTGALDLGSIQIIQSITGSPDYTRDEVIDARINQALKNLNDNVENELRGTGTVNKFYKPYIPPEISDEREKAIIENYYTNPNDPDNLKMYQDLIRKRGL